MSKLKGIGSKYRNMLAAILNKRMAIIDAKGVAEVLKISESEARRLLHRLNKSGWINRIKRGMYVPQPMDLVTENSALEDPLVIAEKIYSPGYVGGFTAIKHWDLSEQIFETICYFTTKKIKHREEVIGNTKFQLKNISPYRLFGTKTIWLQNIKVKISDPTKTIIDLLDDPTMVGGMSIVFDFFQEYMNSKFYDFKLLLDYGIKNKNKTVFKRLGFMMEAKGAATPEQLNMLLSKISKGLSLFDPALECASVVKRWNLKVPTSWKKEYDRKK